MNFATLKTELSDRGFTALGDTRLGQYINAGYHEFNEEHLWPWRIDTETGAAPLTVTDLGTIEEVVNTANGSTPLCGEDRRTLRDAYGDLTRTGTPEYFYRDDQTTIRTYPVGGTLSVRHYKVAADLTGADTPIIPSRYHLLIVDYAVRQAYRVMDNHSAAEHLDVEIQRRLAKVVEAVLNVQVANPIVTQVTAGSEDW